MRQTKKETIVRPCLTALAAIFVSAGALAGVSSTLPDWSKAGYKGGAAIPSDGTIVAMTSKGITANDGVDDTAAIQTVIDQIRAGTLKVNGAVVSESNRAILSFPAGIININKQIRVDASHITLRGAGNSATTGTRFVFKPAATYTNDNGLPVIDGKIWPGYAAFRVEDRTKSSGDTTYEGSINFHWLSGAKVASGGGGTKGSNQVTVASGKGSSFAVGDTVYVGATTTVPFYDQMQAPQEYRYNTHMQSQLMRVTARSGDVLTLDKPLEFDIPFSNGGQLPSTAGGTSNTTYYSKVMKVTAVKGVGFEDFYFTQDISGTPYAGTINANDYDATTNPNGVGLKYKNMAPEYALHGILFKWAQDGWVKGVRTYMTGSHPIVTEFARNMEFSNNVIFGSWNKGKGGHGYFRGSKLFDSKITGNTIDRARHLTLQWSATGNVVENNTLSVDMNLHGGWERNNLIQKNTINIPFEHSSWGEGEGGQDVLEGTWYPIWWGAGPHASKWSGASGPQNVFFNNTLKKQKTKGGAYVSFAPYSSATTIYQIGWDGSTWTHLQKPTGTYISTWGGNEEVYYNNAPNKGVYSCLSFTGTSLLASGTATNSCTGSSSSSSSSRSSASSSSAAPSSSSSSRSSSSSSSAAPSSSSSSRSSSSSSSTPVGTKVTLTASEDTYSYESNPTKSYGSETTFVLKTASGAIRQAFVKFSLSGAPAITSAKLRVYGNASAASTLTAYQVADGWAEGTLTWSNQPAAGAAAGSVSMSATNQYYEIDVSNYVKAQTDGTVSFLLKESAGKYVTINSKENGSNKPQLVIN